MFSLIVGIRNFILSALYKYVIKHIIFLWSPEDAHSNLKTVGKILQSNFLFRWMTHLMFGYGNKRLNTTVDGVHYPNPVGLSAGFDKDGELTGIYPHLSFGLAELGSFTGEYCPGNPGQRLWRLKKSRSILVWYGLNNRGAETISKELAGKKFRIPIGISAAKSNIEEKFDLQVSIDDYMKTYNAFRDIGDYYTINISCPNTQDGEPFVNEKNLKALCDAIKKDRVPNKPVYVKLAANLTKPEIKMIVETCMENGIDGFVCSNLEKVRDPAQNPDVKDEMPYHKGAMSGQPLQRRATDQVRYIYRLTRGQTTIIGVGGIFTARDAYEKITSGANLLHMITGMIFDGPQTMSEINRGLVKLLKADGFSSIEEAVGSRNPLPSEEEWQKFYGKGVDKLVTEKPKPKIVNKAAAK